MLIACIYLKKTVQCASVRLCEILLIPNIKLKIWWVSRWLNEPINNGETYF